MKLNKIVPNNFRQFYGTHEITFASGEKNITLIKGENGTGKTGIFRALIFSLFGETHLAQDNTNDELHIVNLKALEENNGGPTNCSVTIFFEDNQNSYKLTRTRTAVKSGGEIKEREGTAELFITDSTGNYNPTPIVNAYEIKKKVNAIVDENTKDFFFFDGEHIDTLARTTNSVKKEVKDGIVKLLKIDEIEEAITILSALSKKERTTIVAKAKELDLDKVESEIIQIELEISEANDKESSYKREKEVLSSNLNEVKDQLKQSEDISYLMSEQENAEKNVEKQKKIVSNNKEKIKEILLSHGTDFLISDYYKDINNYLDQILSKKNDIVPINLIKKSLQDSICVVCGSKLSEHSPMRHHVELLEENYKREELTSIITNMQITIDEFEKHEELLRYKMDENLREFSEEKMTLDSDIRTVEDFKKDIAKTAITRSEFSQLQENSTKMEEDLGLLNSKILNNKQNLDDLLKKRKAKEKEFKELLGTEKGLEKDKKVLEFIDDLTTELKNIFETYSDGMRERLSKESSTIFKKLISSNDREMVSEINITDKYEIEVKGFDNLNITMDLSQGQRQIVSLSFITALASIATKNFSDHSFPLFMDTPFGRISGDNRNQLINNIPSLTSQWVLLLTDTELTSKEEFEFKGTNKVGNFYELHKQEDGVTEIIESKL